MVPIDIVEIFDWGRHDCKGPRWCDVKLGQGLVYPDGALFIVESYAMRDRSSTTFLLRCVVPPAIGDYEFGDLSVINCENNWPLPEGLNLVDPTE